MSRHVLVAHRACVVLPPDRNGSGVTALARVETPVALVEADPGSFSRPARRYGYVALHKHPIEPWTREGLAWHPLVHAVDDHRPPRTTPDEFVAWLSGELPPEHPAARGLARAFAGSALAPAPSRPRFGQGVRGAADPAAWRPGAGETVADDRADAAAAVRRLAAEGILVAGDAVLVRFRPMLRYELNNTGKRAQEVLALTPDLDIAEPFLSLRERYYANTLMSGSRVEFSDPVNEYRKEFLGLADDRDLELLAAGLPGLVRMMTEPYVTGARPVPANRDEAVIRAADARLAVMERRGPFGLFDAEDTAAAIEEAHRAWRVVRQDACHAIPNNRYRLIDRVMNHVERSLVKRIADRVLDDAPSLESLAP